jgi:hypothetical protein
VIFHPGATALAIRAISYTISNLTFCQQLSKALPWAGMCSMFASKKGYAIKTGNPML